ncbi:hypothetical protein [Actinomadura roseirufa]|uniref:hypothetical protein n=1 Tax=Actinomadura roseirufa TaxID=2094049 RepID=UPI00104193DD|nr:hypothetical protein [Actinomadura roseirufa]
MHIATRLAGGVLAATALASSGAALADGAFGPSTAKAATVSASKTGTVGAGTVRAQPPAPSALASVPNCKGKGRSHILAKYGHVSTKYGYPVALRCGVAGKKGWGYKHFSARWTSSNFETHLERTLNYPTAVKQGGDNVIVCRKVNRSGAKKWFKVVHTTFWTKKEKGIITAVWEGTNGTCETW